MKKDEIYEYMLRTLRDIQHWHKVQYSKGIPRLPNTIIVDMNGCIIQAEKHETNGGQSK